MLKFALVTFLSGILSGMGIGGGSIFVLLMDTFFYFSYDTIKFYNLLSFVCIGSFSSFENLKKGNIDKNILKKIILFIIIGAFLGSYVTKFLNSKDIKFAYYIFLLIIGIYEIFTSLKNIKKGKNNIKRERR